MVNRPSSRGRSGGSGPRRVHARLPRLIQASTAPGARYVPSLTTDAGISPLRAFSLFQLPEEITASHKQKSPGFVYHYFIPHFEATLRARNPAF